MTASPGLLRPGVLFAASLLLAATLLVYQPYFLDGNVPKWLMLSASLAVAFGYLAWTHKGVLDKADLWAFAFIGWMALSLLWSPDPLYGLYAWTHWALLVATFMALRRLPQEFVGWGLLFAVIGSFSILWLDGYHGGFGNENFQAEFLIAAIPMTLSTLPGWIIGSGVLIWLATRSGAVVWAMGPAAASFWFLWRWRWPMAVGMVVLAALAVVSLGTDSLGLSVSARIQLWAGTIAMAADSPIWGHGLGSFDYLFTAYQNADQVVGMGGRRMSSVTEFAGAAHNEYLQLLAEIGVIGLILAFLWLKAAIHAHEYMPIWPVATLLIIAGIAAVDFPLQIPGTGIVAAAALAAVSPVQERGLPLRRESLALIAVLLVVVGGFHYRAAEAQIKMSSVAGYIKNQPGLAFIENLHAYELFPYDKQTRLQQFPTLSRAFTFEESFTLDPETADLIYERSQTASPGAPGLLLSRMFYLINSGRCTGECEAITDWLQKNHGRVPDVWAASALYYYIVLGDEARARDALSHVEGRREVVDQIIGKWQREYF
jgi:O-antigen ligase